MHRAVDERAIPGIVVAAGDSERLLFHEHYGWSRTVPSKLPLGLDSVFDLASLTKVVATTTLAALAADEGMLNLDGPLSRFFPEFGSRPPSTATVRQLMTHTAGFIWWRPYYRTCHSREKVLAAIFAEELVTPPGEERKYSDLSYILLGETLQRVFGEPLDVLAGRRIFAPLGMADTCFRPGPELQPRCVSTEIEEGCDLPVCGVVHDENARAMGGVSGHAGLFSTAYDLSRFARAMLRRGDPVMPESAFARLMTGDEASGSRWLGWVGLEEGGFLSDVFSLQAFGHTGFTGTSIWMDPGNDLFVAVLTNGVHPKRRDDDAVMNTRVECYRAAVALVRGYHDAYAAEGVGAPDDVLSKE